MNWQSANLTHDHPHGSPMLNKISQPGPIDSQEKTIDVSAYPKVPTIIPLTFNKFGKNFVRILVEKQSFSRFSKQKQTISKTREALTELRHKKLR